MDELNQRKISVNLTPYHKEIVIVVVVKAAAPSASPSAAPVVSHSRVIEEHVPVPVELVPHLVKGGVGIEVMLLMLRVSRPSGGVSATAERRVGRVAGRVEGRRRPLTAARVHLETG